jgi:enamine deaminase RidA (YjgF/YER057c/UK114 family)
MVSARRLAIVPISTYDAYLRLTYDAYVNIPAYASYLNARDNGSLWMAAPPPAHKTDKDPVMTQREAIFPEGRHAIYEKHGYSAAVRSGDLLFVSGQVGSRPDGSPEPLFSAQVELAFENLKATLLAAGCTFEDVLDVTTFHTDPERQFETVLPLKERFFATRPYPAWTALGVTWLAGFDFEIKVIARIP